MKKIILMFLLTISVSIPFIVHAQATDVLRSALNQTSENAELGKVEEGKSVRQLTKVLSQIVNYIVGFLGVISVALIVYAGGTWLTAAGNEEKVGRAKKILATTVIGIAIVSLAYSITFFVLATVIG